MKAPIFRQVSLDRLSSPEQLDQALQVTTLRIWILLIAVLLLLASAGVWAFEGRVVTTAPGTGVIVRQGGVLNIVTRGGGVILDLQVVPGNTVKAHQVVATIAQPSLVRQLQLLENARAEAVLDRQRNMLLSRDASILKTTANTQQRSNIEEQITQLKKRTDLLSQQIATEEQLYRKGLVTNQQVLDLRQKLVDINEQVASAYAAERQLDADRFVYHAAPQQQDLEQKARITALDRQIAAAKGNLDLARQVVSPYDGQVLEVKTSQGSTVSDGQPILSMQPSNVNLEVLAYIPSQLAKEVRVGMNAQISPSHVKREEYGFMRGQVSFVADYPATEASITRNFANDPLTKAVSASGPVTEIDAILNVDPSTTSGFAWSTSKGPEAIITSGTLCQIDIVTKREKPITLLLPYLRLR